MKNEYQLQTQESGRYQQLVASSDSAIVKSLSIYGFGDSIHFERKTGENSTFGSYWGIHNIGCFKEIKKRVNHISEMSHLQIRNLAGRLFELLYQKPRGEERYNTKPKIEKTNSRYTQIEEELLNLQRTQRRMLRKGEVEIPGISQHELSAANLW